MSALGTGDKKLGFHVFQFKRPSNFGGVSFLSKGKVNTEDDVHLELTIFETSLGL